MNSRKLILDLANTFANNFQQSQQQIELEQTVLEKLQQQIANLVSEIESGEEFNFTGQDLINHIFTMHPNIAHLIPRDLLWFMGGPCLHYLSDEELGTYNQLDDLRFQAEQQNQDFDWNQSKSSLLGSH